MNKIEELTKQLISELELHGYTVNDDECSHFDVWIYKNRLSVERQGEWKIPCGEVTA